MKPSLLSWRQLALVACLAGFGWFSLLGFAQDRGLSAVDLIGRWAGEAKHQEETMPFAVFFESGKEGALLAKFSLPRQNAFDFALGPATIAGNDVSFGPFTLSFDRNAGTLSGTLPAMLVPVYSIPVTLRRTDTLERPARASLTAPVVEPLWTFDLGAPAWADVAYARDRVYAGADDGELHAVDAWTGASLWSFKAGGAIRSRATVAGDELYLQADDGFLYRLSAETGEVRFRVKVVETPIVRIPNTEAGTRVDVRASAVTVAEGRLYLGTHDGHVLALDAASGARQWDFRAKDSVLAAPALDGGRLFTASYGGQVFALDSATGKELWSVDLKAPVVSTPVPVGGVVVVGSRGYDLVGLDAATGHELWRRYVWYSWIESSATARGGVVYLGSSDAAKIFALDPKTGKSLWEADVHGITWGQPAVAGRRVFAGVQGSHGLIDHEASALALDRASGEVVWRFPIVEPRSRKPWGFAGSPAVGSGRVFLAGLDGKLYAFDANAPALLSMTLPPELDRVLRDYEKAWGATDAAALASLFTEDGFVLSSDSPPVRGRAAIEKHYQGAGGPLHLRAFAFETRNSTGFIVGGYRRLEKGPDSGKFTLTLRKGTDGRWLIVSDMDNGNWGE